MTRGQRAIAVISPEPEKGGRGETVRLPDGLSKQRISEARIGLRYSIDGDLANDALAGTSLDTSQGQGSER